MSPSNEYLKYRCYENEMVGTVLGATSAKNITNRMAVPGNLQYIKGI